MKSGEYGMTLNIDSYLSLDGWLTIKEHVLLGADRNYAITGSIDDSSTASGAVVSGVLSIRPSALNRENQKFAFEDVDLHGAVTPGSFALRGRSGDVPIELRCRWQSD